MGFRHAVREKRASAFSGFLLLSSCAKDSLPYLKVLKLCWDFKGVSVRYACDVAPFVCLLPYSLAGSIGDLSVECLLMFRSSSD